MSTRLEIDFSQAEALFDRLPKRVRTKAVPGTLKAGAKPIVKEAKRILKTKIDDRKGNLRKSIGAKRDKRFEQGKFFRVNIGPRQFGKWEGYHGHLIEFGHRGNKRSGPVQAYPFLRPAAQRKKDEAMRIVAEELGPRIAKEAIRLSRK